MYSILNALCICVTFVLNPISETRGVKTGLIFLFCSLFLPQKTFEPNVHAVRKSKDEWVDENLPASGSLRLKRRTRCAVSAESVCGDYKYGVRFLPRLKEEIHVAPKRERRQRRRRANRGGRRERPPTIQSHSIFEQGPADSVRRAGEASFFSLEIK